MFLRRSPRRGVRIGARTNWRPKPQPQKNKQHTRCNSLHKLPLKQPWQEFIAGKTRNLFPTQGITPALPCAGDSNLNERPPFLSSRAICVQPETSLMRMRASYHMPHHASAKQIKATQLVTTLTKPDQNPKTRLPLTPPAKNVKSPSISG